MKRDHTIIISILSLLVSYSSIAQNGWTVYNSTNTILNSGAYRAISIGQSGNIWTEGQYTGLFKFDGTQETDYNGYNSNILNDDIYDIFVDNANQVWIENYDGISVYNGLLTSGNCRTI